MFPLIFYGVCFSGTGSALLFTHDNIDDTIVKLTVEFFLHLIFEFDDILEACVIFKGKMQIYLDKISIFMGIDGMKLGEAMVEPGQYIQDLHLHIFGKRLVCQVRQSFFRSLNTSAHHVNSHEKTDDGGDVQADGIVSKQPNEQKRYQSDAVKEQCSKCGSVICFGDRTAMRLKDLALLYEKRGIKVDIDDLQTHHGDDRIARFFGKDNGLDRQCHRYK